MDILSGEATYTRSFFVSLLNEGQLLKKIICSPRSKFLPLRADTLEGCRSLPSEPATFVQRLPNVFHGRLENVGLSLYKRLWSSSLGRTANKKLQKLFPFVTMEEKNGNVPI